MPKQISDKLLFGVVYAFIAAVLLFGRTGILDADSAVSRHFQSAPVHEPNQAVAKLPN